MIKIIHIINTLKIERKNNNKIDLIKQNRSLKWECMLQNMLKEHLVPIKKDYF